MSEARKNILTGLDFVPTSTVNSHHDPEVSASDLREWVALAAQAPFDAQGQSAFVFRLKGAPLDEWIRQRSGREDAHLSLLAYLDTGDPALAAKISDDPVSTVQHRIDSFLKHVAKAYNQRQRRSSEWREIKDLLDAYCDATHRQSGGDGRTPPIGKREHSGTSCSACSARAAMFGPPGELEQSERREARAKLAGISGGSHNAGAR